MNSKPTSSGAKPRILVVEDDAQVLLALAGALRHAGYLVSMARQRDRALTILKRGIIDLVIADSILSGGNGESIAAQTELPVLLISGHPERIARLQDGPIPFLAKPFAPSEVVPLVRQMLAMVREPRDNH